MFEDADLGDAVGEGAKHIVLERLRFCSTMLLSFHPAPHCCCSRKPCQLRMEPGTPAKGKILALQSLHEEENTMCGILALET